MKKGNFTKTGICFGKKTETKQKGLSASAETYVILYFPLDKVFTLEQPISV